VNILLDKFLHLIKRFDSRPRTGSQSHSPSNWHSCEHSCAHVQQFNTVTLHTVHCKLRKSVIALVTDKQNSVEIIWSPRSR